MAIGWITLAMYLLPNLIADQAERIVFIRAYWVDLAVVIAAFAMVLGVANLFSVHWGRAVRRQRGWFYSIAALLAACAVIIVSLLDVMTAAGSLLQAPGGQAAGEQILAQGIAGPNMTLIYTYGLYPLQSSLAALLAFLLAFAAYRTLRLRRGLNALLFLGAAVIGLAAQAMPALPPMAAVRDWLVETLATAGLRGVLLGIALGTLVTLIRVLVGFDRPASE